MQEAFSTTQTSDHCNCVQNFKVLEELIGDEILCQGWD
jgi:hypothetical protein